MRAREVSVGIQENGGELIVVVRFKVKSPGLEREAIPFGNRVKETARKQKEKELQRILESTEFPDA
jgi:hypothetical protein